jgi:hypothetical protein
MFRNFYSSGRCDIINGNVVVLLMPDHHIYYCLFSDDEADYKYDLLCEVGEIWKQDVLDILAEYNIVTGYYESATEYYNTWISYDGCDVKRVFLNSL